VSTTIPFFGGLTSTDRTVTLQSLLPERTWIYHIDRARQTVAFEAQGGDLWLEPPVGSMRGTVGVAPAAFEACSSLSPDKFGGTWTRPRCVQGRLLPRRQLRDRQEQDLHSEVEAHWRLQACGPRHSERERIWIDEHYRGPEDTPVRPAAR
jgi:hypothetical protein